MRRLNDKNMVIFSTNNIPISIPLAINLGTIR